MTKREITLNELSKWTPWVERVLGFGGFNIQKRDVKKIEEEYNQDKWLKCLNMYEAGQNSMTAVEYMMSQDDISPDDDRCVNRDGKLVITSARENYEFYYDFLYDLIKDDAVLADNFVELGSAFGPNLWALSKRFPDLKFVGAEYSENAVKLGNLLLADDGITFRKFNFYDQTSYEFLENLPGKSIVFTSIAIEQCESARSIIEALRMHKSKIHKVINVEPSYELLPDDTYGLMCKKYIEINKYNTDIYSLLTSSDDIEVNDMIFAKHSFNPMLPLTAYSWEFV